MAPLYKRVWWKRNIEFIRLSGYWLIIFNVRYLSLACMLITHQNIACMGKLFSCEKKKYDLYTSAPEWDWVTSENCNWWWLQSLNLMLLFWEKSEYFVAGSSRIYYLRAAKMNSGFCRYFSWMERNITSKSVVEMSIHGLVKMLEHVRPAVIQLNFKHSSPWVSSSKNKNKRNCMFVCSKHISRL